MANRLAERALAAGELVLRPIVPAHAAALFERLQADELYLHIPDVAPPSRAALRDRYRRWSRRGSKDGGEIWLNYAVYHRRLRAYVGTVQATVVRGGDTHIAYQTFPEFWRRGYARAACRALIAHLFRGYGVVTVSALLDTENEPSRRLLESLGFQHVRTIAGADEFKGRVSDEYLYQKIRRGKKAGN